MYSVHFGLVVFSAHVALVFQFFNHPIDAIGYVRLFVIVAHALILRNKESNKEIEGTGLPAPHFSRYECADVYHLRVFVLRCSVFRTIRPGRSARYIDGIILTLCVFLGRRFDGLLFSVSFFCFLPLSDHHISGKPYQGPEDCAEERSVFFSCRWSSFRPYR